MRTLTALDLFSGCGGLTLGLTKAGFKVKGAVEVDPLAVETYRRNHKGVNVWERDIRRLPVSEVAKKLGLSRGRLDLLAGCPPCQGFSSLRTLNGGRSIVDPRNDLVFEFIRFARQLRPKAIMIENVPGLAADGRIPVLIQQLQRLGYSSQYRVLDAANYGVPQRRRRMIFLASRDGSIAFAAPDSRHHTVRQTIESLRPPGRSNDRLHDLPERRASRTKELIKKIPKDGGSRTDLGDGDQLACHRKCNGFKDVYGRMAWDVASPTITSGCVNPSKGRFLHPRSNRAITLREAALLQTFPRKYYFSLKEGKYRAAAMIGNALPPEFVRRHALEAAKHLHAIGNGSKSGGHA